MKWIDEVLQVALMHMPVPLPAPAEALKPPEAIAGDKRRRRASKSSEGALAPLCLQIHHPDKTITNFRASSRGASLSW